MTHPIFFTFFFFFHFFDICWVILIFTESSSLNILTFMENRMNAFTRKNRMNAATFPPPTKCLWGHTYSFIKLWPEVLFPAATVALFSSVVSFCLLDAFQLLIQIYFVRYLIRSFFLIVSRRICKCMVNLCKMFL